MTTHNHACGNCRYAHADLQSADAVSCRRNPPQIILAPHNDMLSGRQGVAARPFFPSMKADDWGCGEFKPVDGAE